MTLFPEPGVPLPAAVSRGTATFLSAGERPRTVRFADGYQLFEAFVRENGIDPATLADDVSSLWDFLSGRDAVLDDPVLMSAAGRFIGNVIAVVHPAATWRVLDEPEVGTTTRSIPVLGLVRTMVEHSEHRGPFLDMLATWDQEDRDDADFRALSGRSTAPPLVIPAAALRRPAFAAATFRDEDGRVIPYGSRWEGREPPEEAYSRVTHPERFAVLARDVDALIEHLRSSYLVDVEQAAVVETEQRIVLRPTTGASMTVTVGVEGVTVEAGALFAQTFPVCACDACDENADTAADDLERTVLAIAAGGFREIYPIGHRRWALTALNHLGGTSTSSGGAPSNRHTAAHLDRAEEALHELADGWWPAWTLR